MSWLIFIIVIIEIRKWFDRIDLHQKCATDLFKRMVFFIKKRINMIEKSICTGRLFFLCCYQDKENSYTRNKTISIIYKCIRNIDHKNYTDTMLSPKFRPYIVVLYDLRKTSTHLILIFSYIEQENLFFSQYST